MKPTNRFVLGIAWANFVLALLGILKFLPLVLVAFQSTLMSNSTVAWRWSLDLISDTHWIFLLWTLVLFAFRFAIGDGALAYFSLAIQAENPIAASQSDPRGFKLTKAEAISCQETRTKHRHRDIGKTVNTILKRLETACGRRSCLK